MTTQSNVSSNVKNLVLTIIKEKTMNPDFVGETRTKKYLLQDAIFGLIRDFEKETGAQVVHVGVQHVSCTPPIPGKWFLDQVEVLVQV